MAKYVSRLSSGRVTVLSAVFILTASALAPFGRADMVTSYSASDDVYTVSNSDLLQTVGTVSPSGYITNESLFTNGAFGAAGESASVAGDGGDLLYTLDTSVQTAGYSIKTIDVYTGWTSGGGRCDPNVTILYSTVTNPDVFTEITTLAGTGWTNTKSSVTEDISGAFLATGVAKIEFSFGAQENGFVGYRELDVFGAAVAVPEPSTLVLLAVGLIGLLAYAWRKRK